MHIPALTSIKCGDMEVQGRSTRTGRLNASIRKAVDCFGGVVIAHPCLRFFDKTIFVPDGVHFTKIGNELFLTSIHSRTSRKFFSLYGLTAHMNENMK